MSLNKKRGGETVLCAVQIRTWRARARKLSIFADEVRPNALDDQALAEPRSKALAHTTALLCYMILKDVDIWRDKTEPTLRAAVS